MKQQRGRGGAGRCGAGGSGDTVRDARRRGARCVACAGRAGWQTSRSAQSRAQVRRHGQHAAAGRSRTMLATLIARVSGAVSRAIWVPDAGPAAGDRVDFGGGRRATHDGSEAVDEAQPDSRQSAPKPDLQRRRSAASVLRRAVARHAVLRPRRTATAATRSRARRSFAKRNTTIVIEPGWRAEVTPLNHLILRRVQPLQRSQRHRHAAPIRCCSKSSTTCSCPSPSRWA